MWHVAPSCWNYLISKSYSSIEGKQNRLSYNHNAPNWWWQSSHHCFQRSQVQSDQRVHHTVTISLCNDLFSLTWGFWEPQIQQFYLLIYPPSVKCASSLKKSLFEKLTSHRVVQANIPRIYSVVNGQLASVVAWVGLYMEVGGNLNAKYAIICCKTVLIPGDNEESTYLGPR